MELIFLFLIASLILKVAGEREQARAQWRAIFRFCHEQWNIFRGRPR